jgi:hypothetical protein
MEQSPFWEVNRFPACREFSRISWKPKVLTSKFATADICGRDLSQDARSLRYHTIDSVCCSLQEKDAIVIGMWFKRNYDDTVHFWQNYFS